MDGMYVVFFVWYSLSIIILRLTHVVALIKFITFYCLVFHHMDISIHLFTFKKFNVHYKYTIHC